MSTLPVYMYLNSPKKDFTVFLADCIRTFREKQGYMPLSIYVNPVNYEIALDNWEHVCNVEARKNCTDRIVQLYPVLNNKRSPNTFKGIRSHA